ncbi:MAG: M48 family metalloprotease [Candidatus Andeanibacterium colombiense]|uniref:M48 family metalloprotease n=1 Tax=Candidatus Andeanibacterium colombiense TaxID=3121345 RepID=A0AAJ5X6F9_9SPHN|nr:MAG: M48 family metalloprotease [Sphingomonadaceae bacterium]
MPRSLRFLARFAAAFALLQIAAQPVAAQSILRDAETEKLLQDMMDPLTVAAGMPKGAVQVVLLQDNTLNAFVAGGQRIYVHSGLLEAADSANEVQGVLAHELGHIMGGHVPLSSEGLEAPTGITILSLLLGVAAMAAGAGEAGMGILAAGQQAAMGKYLAFSRTQEATADAAGVQYLSKAHISGRGSLSFFKKLANQEFRYGYDQSDEASYSRSHPMTMDRIATLEHDYEADPAWNTPDDPVLQDRFLRAKAKLYGYLATPADTLRSYPPYMTGVPARYARAYAYHKDAQVDKALAETQALIAADPADPYFLELEGQILLESGRPAEAIDPLRRATQMTGNTPLIATTFGHALIATEKPEYFDEAARVLKSAVARDRENPFAWYQLGVIYANQGDLPRARLASAEQQSLSGDMEQAMRSAEAAEQGLPAGSPDWIRAGDIALAAKAELERGKKRR